MPCVCIVPSVVLAAYHIATGATYIFALREIEAFVEDAQLKNWQI